MMADPGCEGQAKSTLMKEKHLRLAGIVKSVHADLRNKYKLSGDAAATWRDHCGDRRVLTEYATAMYSLATHIWTKHDITRIHWCHNACLQYFHHGGIQKALQKDQRRQQYFNQGCSIHNDSHINLEDSSENIISEPVCDGIRLLDVGSCYNPFQAYPQYHTLAIDISPATQTVHSCDFLDLQLADTWNHTDETFPHFLASLPHNIESLPQESFHVVVFSLLLEYLPSYEQRLTCCHNAHRLLLTNGLLLIITPDSHHQNRNSAMMRSWRTLIESLGFLRYKYEKLDHLHCMVFRKTSVRLRDSGQISADMLYIPQDFHHVTDSHHNHLDEDVTEITNNFSQLPLYDDVGL